MVMTKEDTRDSLTGSGKIVARGMNRGLMANSTPDESGILKKGGKQPTKAPPPPKVSNQAPKPPPGSGTKGKK